MEKQTVAERIAALLRVHGVEHVFGVPSGDWLPYMEAFAAAGIEFVLVANEASAGFMAAVYGWLRGVPGVCYGTFGPGATNLATGVGGAYLDRAPVIAFTSETPDSALGRTKQMMIDHQELFRPITKWTTRLNVANVDGIVHAAVREALAEYPGPVHIGLPSGIGDQPAGGGAAAAGLPASAHTPAPDAVSRAVAAIRGASRPVLAVGLSAIRPGVAATIDELSRRLAVPVVLTPMAKGMLPEDHPWYAGVLFHALSDRVAETHRQADLVIGVGYDPVEFDYESWMPTVPLIHIDPRPADIDRRAYPHVIDVVGDIAPALDFLLAEDLPVAGWDMAALAERRRRMFADLEPRAGLFGPFAAISILREELPENGIMTCDVGAHTHLIGQAWRTPDPAAQLMSNGWSSMGFGVPSAIGAGIARPDRPVVCVTGDGGFMMMAGEMATARRQGLPIVFVVLRDRALGLIRIKQGRRGSVSDATILEPDGDRSADFLFGVPVRSVSDADGYRRALREALAAQEPTIIEAHIEISEYEETILRPHK